MAELLFKDEVYAIVGAAMEVYNDLGPGFLELVYQEAMEMEVELRKIPFKPQHQIVIEYKGRPLKKSYVADLLCCRKIVVEIKALEHLTLREEAQLLKYLKATGLQVGVLINFGKYPSLEWKRMILTKRSDQNQSPRNLKENQHGYQS